MKKVLVITTIIAISVVTLTFFELQKCNENNKTENKRIEIKIIEKEIDTINKQIDEANKKIEEINESNKEKIELLKLWRHQLEKLQNNI